MNKVTPLLMFNDQLGAAIEFYAATFPNSEVRNVARTGKDGPISSAEFAVGGQLFMGYNGGPYFSFSEGVSLYVNCADQDEVDEYWDKLVKAGAKPTPCGWIKDPFGLSWQIAPRRFTESIYKAITETVPADPDHPDFRLGKTLGAEYTNWRRVKKGCLIATACSFAAPRGR